MLFGLEQQSPKAKGQWRGAAFPEPFAWHPVPTRHQREPVKPAHGHGFLRPHPVCCNKVVCMWTCPITVSHTALTWMSIRSLSLHHCVISYKNGPQPVHRCSLNILYDFNVYSDQFLCLVALMLHSEKRKPQIHRLPSAGEICHMTAQNYYNYKMLSKVLTVGRNAHILV